MSPADLHFEGEDSQNFLAPHGPMEPIDAFRMSNRFFEMGVHVSELTAKEFMVARAAFEGRGMLIVVKHAQTCQCCDRPLFTMIYHPKVALPLEVLFAPKKP